MSSNNSKGGGSGLAEGSATPRFNSISPSNGQAYISSARKYCLQTLSEVVSTFCRGTLPIEMLEHPLPYNKRNMLGRKAFKYTNTTGTIMTVDQTVSAWRTELINKTKTENENCTEEEALELLFPASSKRAREAKRQSFATQTLVLMHNLNLLWPADAMILEMDKNQGIQDATDSQDLIAWENAFTAFCLDNCGNADMNVRQAEDTLDSTFMKGHDLSAYVKAFRIAFNNVRQCNSSYTERRIVELFIRNLNQSEDAFYRFSRKILDSSDTLYALASQPLESAITHVETYYKSVIVPELAASKRKKAGSDRTTTISTVAELEKVLKAGGSKDNQISVSHAVLTTLQKEINKRKSSDKEENERKKAKATVEAKAKAKAEAIAKAKAVEKDKNKDDPESKEEKKCFRFNTKKGCHFGDNCKFSHSA